VDRGEGVEAAVTALCVLSVGLCSSRVLCIM
jgi:hypothetical protein